MIVRLTKEEAIRLHRELWNWLADNPEKGKEDWPEWKDMGHIESNCFACEYSGPCHECLFEWPNGNCLEGEEAGVEGLYLLWATAESEERVALAIQIRDLPVREEC